MKISPTVKAALTAVVLGVVASAVWDGIKLLWGIRVAAHELVQLGYFLLIAGVAVYLGTRISRKSGIFIAPQGTALRIAQDANLCLTIFSTRTVELRYLRADVSGVMGQAFTVESHDPTIIKEMVPTPLSFAKSLTDEEKKRIEGTQVPSVNGYAKFDGQLRVDFQWAGPIAMNLATAKAMR